MRLQVSLLLSLLVFCANNTAIAQPHRLIVGTFNLRYDNPADTGNLWINRAPIVVSMIRFHEFDILGTQEGLQHQLNDISTSLSEFDRYGVGRDDGIDKGEHSAIFYKKERFSLLNKGDFWLSETPEKPSLGWDATCCKRICSWVQLSDHTSGKELWCFNVHYDHQGKIAREESSKLLQKKIKEIAGDGMVVLMGDFNGSQSSSWYQRIATSGLLEDTYKQAQHPYAPNPTFHAFGKQLSGNDVIDHIFTSKDFTIKRWGILSDSYHGKYPSDHFPVLAEIAY